MTVGAIGIFYREIFTLEGVSPAAGRAEALEAWFAQYGDKWELHHMEKYFASPEPVAAA